MTNQYLSRDQRAHREGKERGRGGGGHAQSSSKNYISDLLFCSTYGKTIPITSIGSLSARINVNVNVTVCVCVCVFTGTNGLNYGREFQWSLQVVNRRRHFFLGWLLLPPR